MTEHHDTTWSTLVQAETLVATLGRDDLVIVDCRFALGDPDSGEAAWRQAHIPGAMYAHLDRDLSDHARNNGGRHPWPDADAFTNTLGAWGITPMHQVVAYDSGDGAFAARLWFLLRALGHEHVAVLDGGFARWQALALPLDAAMPSPGVRRYAAQFDQARLFDAHAVQVHLAHGGLLVDARGGERFRGDVEPIDRTAGHVPGAVNRPYANNLVDGRFKSPERLQREFRDLLGAYRAQDMVAMCGSGVTACHHLLAMAHAGLPGAKLFTGSWSGWIEDPARPVATGEA